VAASGGVVGHVIYDDAKHVIVGLSCHERLARTNHVAWNMISGLRCTTLNPKP
jgi:hypothetical protein